MSRASEIVKYYEYLRLRRTNFDNLAQEIVDYILPHNADITTLRSPGEKKTQRIFDSTAGYGAHVFSQFVQGSVFNQSTKWFSLKHKDEQVNSDQEAASWLNRSRDKMLASMRTTFYGPAGQAINAWTAFGNGPLLIEDVPQRRDGLGKIKYTSVPFGQYVMAEGDDGRIDQFARCLRMPASQAVKLGNVSDDIKNAAEKEPMKEFEIIHSIMPRDFQAYSKSRIRTAKDMQFESCWVEKGKNRLIKESGYRKFPVAVARYDLIAGETYARGPAELALPDAKSLNQADQKALLKWDRELDPPTLTRRGSIIGRILDKRSGGDTVVTDIERSVRPLFEGSNWQAHDTMAARKEQAILRVFHVNEILNLLSRESPQMTAFEVNARLTLLQQILGPVFGILETDFLSVIVNVTLDNLAHAGELDEVPDSLQAGDDLLNIVYEGPLARAQRNQEILSIQQSVADTAGVQPFFPEAVKLVDWQKTIRRLWDIRGTQDLLVSERDFTAAVNEMIAQQNAEKEMALIAGGAEALGKAAPGIKVLREEPGRAAA